MRHVTTAPLPLVTAQGSATATCTWNLTLASLPLVTALLVSRRLHAVRESRVFFGALHTGAGPGVMSTGTGPIIVLFVFSSFYSLISRNYS